MDVPKPARTTQKENKMKGPVYLAGPITGLTWQKADDWRLNTAKELAAVGIGCIDPLRGMRYAGKATGDGAHHELEGHSKLSAGHLITCRDAYGVRCCSALLANLLGAKKVSVGTTLEIGMAYALNKYIMLVMEPEGNPHDHGIVLDMASTVCNTMEDATQAMTILLGGLP